VDIDWVVLGLMKNIIYCFFEGLSKVTIRLFVTD
jgi:hypothetical protein